MTELRETLDRLRGALKKHGAPSHDERIAHLTKLERALIAKKEELVKAVSEDFGSRSRHESLQAEVFVTINLIRHAKERLREWMEPEAREISWLFAPSTGEVIYQPLGVVGVIAPWNYPVQLALSPVVSALAAGNRVMVKPSDVTPKSGEFLKALLAETFGNDHVVAITGDASVAKEFAALPFDHLFFTGGTRIGKEIMRAASENLVPVTLELGGKSPTIVGADANVKNAAMRIMAGKTFNAGQTCVAPDYALVPKKKLDAFIEASKASVAKLYPTLLDNPDYSSIVNDRHYDRLASYLEEAKSKDAKILSLNPKNEDLPKARRKMAPTLLVDPPEELSIMKEEVFGPILPIRTYETLDEAIAYVNERPRPLALYYFGGKRRDIDRVLSETVTGGVAINDVMMQFAQEDLPFGGVGPSGFGDYHGREGFLTMSKKKAVFYQSRLAGTALFRPPYGKVFDVLFRLVVGK